MARNADSYDPRLFFDPMEPLPRVILDPSPDVEFKLGAGSLNVWHSDQYTGAYVALMDMVPVTRYFEILRRADCDGVFLITNGTQMRMPARTLPQSPAYKCVAAMGGKYASKDPSVADGDGVLLDMDQMEVTNPGLLYLDGQRRVVMKGWAIRFKQPSSADIQRTLTEWLERDRNGFDEKLAGPDSPRDNESVHNLQLRTALFWIAKHRASEFESLVGEIVKKYAGRSREWPLHAHEATRTYAVIAPTQNPKLWWSILQEKRGRGGAGAHGPEIAANVIACNPQSDTLDRLMEGLADPNIVFQGPYLGAYFRAAYTLDRNRTKEFVEKQRGLQWDNYRNVVRIGMPWQFQCPYRIKSVHPDGDIGM